MKPEDFKIWRGRLGLTQVGAAAELELTPRAIKHYEAGTRRITPQIEMLTAAVARNHWREKHKNKGVHDFYDPRDVVATPQDFFERLNSEFSFTLDVCAVPENAKCPVYFTPEMNGLAQVWSGAVWMNPPYFRGRIAKWIAKAYNEIEAGHCTVVVALVHVVNDTRWWHDFVLGKSSEVRFVRGRLNGFGRSVIVVFRPRDHAAKIGTIMARAPR
jgi:phage N-6-adenine-methyltransferase